MPACRTCGHEVSPASRFCDHCGTEVGIQLTERRKLVTVLFCDVAGSTQLGDHADPETVRELMSAYFSEARAAIEAHGGTVEKFIGDAVMAVFGVPDAHEDDAIRAVRGAAELQQRISALNEDLERRTGNRILLRIGVNTGEVVAGAATAREVIVTGDAVNVAARLEQAARPGETLLGSITHELVRHAAVAEPVDPIRAKGKRDPIPAYRLVSLLEIPTPRMGRRVPLVGRWAELETLRAAFTSSRSEQRPALAMVVGDPGVGKTRLTEEFLNGQVGALILRGRSLPYGEGITYWPLAEAVRQAAHIERNLAHHIARERVASLAGSDAEALRVAELVATAIGVGDRPGTPAEIGWAFVRLFGAIARDRPIVLLLDDLQWAEPLLLDLVERLARDVRGPLFVLGVCRPEVFERRPTLAATVRLEALAEGDAAMLVDELLGGPGTSVEVRSKLLRASQGNPLFIEELVSMLVDDGTLRRDGGAWELAVPLEELRVPPTIEALLEARLDRLDPSARTALECGSVEGERFHAETISALLNRMVAPAVLHDLVERGYVRQEPGLSGEAYAFSHILLRDVTYRQVPKRRRVDLHERFARLVTGMAGAGSAELEEIVGYHLEQSFRYRTELAPIDERARAVGEEAAQCLANAARRNMMLGNPVAASHLFNRALALLPEESAVHLRLLAELAVALNRQGNPQQGMRTAARAVARAEATGDELARAWAIPPYVAGVGFPHEFPSMPIAEARREIERAAAVLREAGDQRGACLAFLQLDLVCQVAGDGACMERALGEMLRLARRAGARAEEEYALGRRCIAAMFDDTPVGELLRRCEEALGVVGEHHYGTPQARMSLAGAFALLGRFDESWEQMERVSRFYEEIDSPFTALLHTAPMAAGIALWEGKPEQAEEVLRPALHAVEKAKIPGPRRWLASTLADALCRQGHLDEAQRLIPVASTDLAADNVVGQIDWRIPAAKILAGFGRLGEAETVANEGVRLARATTFTYRRVWMLEAMADVLTAANRTLEARPFLEEAVAIAEAKGATALTAIARTRLAAG